MEEGFSKKLDEINNFIMIQLSDDKLRPLIEEAIASTISKHISEYINSIMPNYIHSIVQQEISKLTEKFNKTLVEILESHSKIADLLRSIQYHLAERINPLNTDTILKAFEEKDFANGFEIFLALVDDEKRISYLRCIDLDDPGLERLPEDLIARLVL